MVNVLDFILLTLLAIALIRGIMRGAIRQVASLVGIVAGFVVAGHLYLRLLPVIKRFLPSVPYSEVISYLLIFAASWVSIILLSLLLVRLSRIVLMSWADRLFGGALGLLKGTVAVVVLGAALTLFLPGTSRLLTGSLLAPYVQGAGHYLVQLTPKDLRKKYQEKHDTLVRQLKQQGIAREIKKKIGR